MLDHDNDSSKKNKTCHNSGFPTEPPLPSFLASYEYISKTYIRNIRKQVYKFFAVLYNACPWKSPLQALHLP